MPPGSEQGVDDNRAGEQEPIARLCREVMPDDREAFELESRANAKRMNRDASLRELTSDWIHAASRHRYSYNFRWLGLPIIQLPQDILAIQELIWRVRPDLVIETGIARGGSTIFYASMLELLGGPGRVVAIDVDIRSHNRQALQQHPLFHRVELIEGSSTDEEAVERAEQAAHAAERERSHSIRTTPMSTSWQNCISMARL